MDTDLRRVLETAFPGEALVDVGVLGGALPIAAKTGGFTCGISYTSEDCDGATWIGLELAALGHVPHDP
jgi:hypothetical protein